MLSWVPGQGVWPFFDCERFLMCRDQNETLVPVLKFQFLNLQETKHRFCKSSMLDKAFGFWQSVEIIIKLENDLSRLFDFDQSPDSRDSLCAWNHKASNLRHSIGRFRYLSQLVHCNIRKLKINITSFIPTPKKDLLPQSEISVNKQ